MKGRNRTALRSVILLLCCVLLCSTVAATGSLRVTVLNQETPMAEFAVELFYVASLQEGTFALAEDFADLRFSAQELAQEQTAEQAEQVYQFIMQRELNGSIVLTDKEGCADFLSIPDGLYLVLERGGQAVAFRPYLITVPTDGRYGVYSTPKTDSGETKNIAVFVEWVDDDDKAGKRPESIQVTLLHNGTPIRTVVINAQCGWEHTFIMLPSDGEYTVEASSVEDYTMTCEEVAEGFLLTYTYEPKTIPGPKPPVGPDRPEDPEQPQLPQEPAPEESRPTLPQTGFRMWPVWVMLALGVGLTVLGLADVYLGKEDLWEEEQEES